MSAVHRVTSRDNPLLVKLRKLVQDGQAYRKLGKFGEVWLEGEHLCRAARQRGRPIGHAVLTDGAWEDAALRALAEAAERVTVVPEALFRGLSSLESPARIGFVMPLGPAPAIEPGIASVVLDRLQDAGNVGTLLRSAAAFGLRQVVALKGSAALWSPKVLRAGMGAHFGLRLVEGVDAAALVALQVPLLATSSHAEAVLHEVDLPSPCAWVFGHEGQGVAPDLAARCALQVRIAQPGGEESLNVGAAAAICFYETVRQAGRVRAASTAASSSAMASTTPGSESLP